MSSLRYQNITYILCLNNHVKIKNKKTPLVEDRKYPFTYPYDWLGAVPCIN